jgi:hypothetical protein
MMVSRCSFSSKSYNAVAVRLISEDGYPNRHIRVKDTLLRGPGISSYRADERNSHHRVHRLPFRSVPLRGTLFTPGARTCPPVSLDLINCTFFGVDTILDIDMAPPIENDWQVADSPQPLRRCQLVSEARP